MSERTLEPEIVELIKIFKDDKRFSMCSIEDLICAIRELVEEDLRTYAMTPSNPPDPTVISCLEACVNLLGDARMAYYASLK